MLVGIISAVLYVLILYSPCYGNPQVNVESMIITGILGSGFIAVAALVRREYSLAGATTALCMGIAGYVVWNNLVSEKIPIYEALLIFGGISIAYNVYGCTQRYATAVWKPAGIWIAETCIIVIVLGRFAPTR